MIGTEAHHTILSIVQISSHFNCFDETWYLNWRIKKRQTKVNFGICPVYCGRTVNVVVVGGVHIVLRCTFYTNKVHTYVYVM